MADDPADRLTFQLHLSNNLAPLTIHTAPLATNLGTGAGLWNGGTELARFLAALPPAWARGSRALEVGCGAAAAPSRALAAMGGHAVATDNDVASDLLALTEVNIKEESHGRVSLAPLPWGNRAALSHALSLLPGPPTLILAADVAYDEDVWLDLIMTLYDASRAATPPAPVLLALPTRPESAGFLGAAACAGWGHRTLRTVPPPDEASVSTDIVQLWPVPETPHFSLVIADFDWSCVEGNTDTLAAASLGPAAEAALNDAMDAGAGWTAAMGAALACGPADVAAAGAAGVGMDGEVRAALARAGGVEGAAAAGLVIVSDANAALIGAALDAHGLTFAPDLIITNPSGVGAAGEMTVAPFHGPGSPSSSEEGEDGPSSFYRPRRTPHSCPACPANLCKGTVVEALLGTARVPPARVCYLGDGHNDACPCGRLVSGGRPGDLILARSHYPDGRAAPLAGVLRGLISNKSRAQVVEWRKPGEAGRAMRAWLQEGGG